MAPPKRELTWGEKQIMLIKGLTQDRRVRDEPACTSSENSPSVSYFVFFSFFLDFSSCPNELILCRARPLTRFWIWPAQIYHGLVWPTLFLGHRSTMISTAKSRRCRVYLLSVVALQECNFFAE